MSSEAIADLVWHLENFKNSSQAMDENLDSLLMVKRSKMTSKSMPSAIFISVLSATLLVGCSGDNTPVTDPVDLGPPPDARLLSSTWVVAEATTSTNAPIQPVTQLIAAGTPAKVDFDADFIYRIDDGGCLIYADAYQYEGDAIQYDPNRSGGNRPSVLCLEPWVDVYPLFRQLFEPRATWTITDSTQPPELTLVGNDGSTYKFIGIPR